MNSSNLNRQPCSNTLFLAVWALIAACSWLHSELRQIEFERRTLSDGATLWTLPNTSFMQDYILPEWVISRIDEELADYFLRITELDFCLDDLNSAELEAIRFYIQFRSVHTIRVRDRYCKPSVVEILRSFKNLQTVNVEPWGTGETEGYIELSSTSLPGVKVTYKK